MSLNRDERAVQPFYVYWKNSLLPMSSSSHKRNIKGAVLPFIESVFSSVIKNCSLLILLPCFSVFLPSPSSSLVRPESFKIPNLRQVAFNLKLDGSPLCVCVCGNTFCGVKHWTCGAALRARGMFAF